MARKRVIPDKFVITRDFHIPEGLESVVYEEIDTSEPIDAEFSDVGTDIMDGVDETPTGGGTPVDTSGFRVVSQTLRTNKSGEVVVDVVIEINDVKGAVEYEPRLTII